MPVFSDTELIHSFRLPNGVLVLTEEVPGIESAAVGIWCDAGSADEEPGREGLAHFLEHMLFKGTERHSAYELAEAIEDVGGQVNAYTEREITHIYARVLTEHLPLAADLLAEMLLTSTFDQTELDRERQVIIEEIRKYESVPEERIQDLIMEGLWHGGGLGHSILGSEESVRILTRDDLCACWRRHFAADRMILTVVGKFSRETLPDLLAAAFTGVPPPQGPTPAVPPGIQLPFLILEEDEEQVNFSWGGRSFAAYDDRNFPLALFDAAFGASTTSRLFQEIREKRGLAYDISSEVVSLRETGYVGAGGATSIETFPEVMELARREIDTLRAHGLTPRELMRSKAQIKSGLALALESTLDRMRRLATHQFTWGKVYSLRYLIDRLEQVTLDDIQQIIAEVLTPESWTFAAIGPVTEDEVKGMIGGE